MEWVQLRYCPCIGLFSHNFVGPIVFNTRKLKASLPVFYTHALKHSGPSDSLVLSVPAFISIFLHLSCVKSEKEKKKKSKMGSAIVINN